MFSIPLIAAFRRSTFWFATLFGLEVICSGFVPAQVGPALVLHGAIAWASRTVNRLKSTGSDIAPLAILNYSNGRTPAANNVYWLQPRGAGPARGAGSRTFVRVLGGAEVRGGFAEGGKWEFGNVGAPSHVYCLTIDIFYRTSVHVHVSGYELSIEHSDI